MTYFGGRTGSVITFGLWSERWETWGSTAT